MEKRTGTRGEKKAGTGKGCRSTRRDECDALSCVITDTVDLNNEIIESS